MTPNAETHNPDPVYLRELIARAGLTQRKTAELIGISDRMIRKYLANRESASALEAPYTVQFCLECLAQKPSD
ncbi:helix-turn-helix domain-containing protein (plasmid) [Methylomonas sp. MS20]|uniref:helix-turn-helix domain-containing protein n=1 Tax=Methylomonas sp. MS20 TaxID=3418769 RepID=UPI003D040B08